MSKLGPTLETPRLTLRPLAPEDFDAWAEMMADESTRFIGGPQSRSGAWRGFVSVAGAWAMQGYSMFSVIEKASAAGSAASARGSRGLAGYEVGWGLTKNAFGQGYATEAAAASIDWAFDALGWTDVIHIIDPENTPSQAVARRLGSTKSRPRPDAGAVRRLPRRHLGPDPRPMAGEASLVLGAQVVCARRGVTRPRAFTTEQCAPDGREIADRVCLAARAARPRLSGWPPRH